MAQSPNNADFSSSFLYKLQRGRVHTIAETGRLGTVIEDVAQMSFASTAEHLISLHPVAVIAFGHDVFWSDGLPKARPPGAGFKLCL
jgi:hypothetical protein